MVFFISETTREFSTTRDIGSRGEQTQLVWELIVRITSVGRHPLIQKLDSAGSELQEFVVAGSDELSVAYSAVPRRRGIFHVVVRCKARRKFSPLPTEGRGIEGLVVTGTVRADALDPGEVLILSGELVNPGRLEVGARLAGLQYGRENSRPSFRKAGLGSGRAEPMTPVVGEEQVARVVVANGEKVEGVVRHVGEKGGRI